MKVDRRSFLGLGIGAVAGVAVSPVGIKLTDDSSIWTQNWPWTPVPVDGEASYENSVCSICPGSCGISVRMIEGRPVKIEGMDGHPVNDGGACLHGIAGLQYLYDPSRVKTPLMKKGDTFEEVSWDDAIDMVSAKLKELKDKGTPEKVACITDKQEGSVAALLQRLIKTTGSSSFYTMQSLEANLQATAASVHGKDKTIGFDLENSDLILSFGAGVLEGWGSPVNCFKANATKKEREAKLYQIEPRLSNTAAGADKWIPVKPGTEADLALGICGIIINNDLKPNVSTSGFKGNFAKLTNILRKEYTVDKVSASTGVAKNTIITLAKKFVKAKTPVAVFGKGRGDGAQSLKGMVAVQVLNCLAGNINKKGGAFVMPALEYLELPAVAMDAVAKKGIAKSKPGKSVNQLIDAINKSATPLIEAMVVYNANPCYSLHDTKSVKDAMDKVPFVVSLSSYLDETTQKADIILPVHTFLEKLEDVPSGAGLNKSVVGLSKPMVKPVFDTKHPGDVLIAVANAMGGNVAKSFEWKTYEECLESVASGIWDSLTEEGYAVVSEGVPSGSVKVDVSYLANNPETVQAQGDFNLTLIPIDNMRLVSSAVAASPFAVKTVADTVLKGKDIVVEINPSTAKGLKDCGYANLTTPMGTVKVKVHLNEGIMPGVIGMVEGLGHDSDNKFVAGKGVNINDLIAPVMESGSGLDAAFGITAKITKA